MYSKAPEIIKQYVPISFSRQSVDYQSSPKKRIEPLDDNPFKNKLLHQHLQINPKDFVLIFKNKSSKVFKAKKKVQFIPLLKNLRNINKNCLVMREQEKKTYNLLMQNNPQTKLISHSLGKQKPSTSCGFRGRSSSDVRLSKPLTSYKHIHPSSFDKNFEYQGADKLIHSQTQSHLLSPHRIVIDQHNPIQLKSGLRDKRFESLRITGSRAPSSQMVQHWKKVSTDSFYQLVGKLVK